MAGADARVAVWDWPVRIVHWLLAALVGLSWWTAETERLDWHKASGLAILWLLLFRLAWGFAGSRTARFASFVRGPRAIAAYLRGRWGTVPGHNPLGALSVVAMLAALAGQVGLGLFSTDIDGLESGPLDYLVSFDTGRAAARAHHLLFAAIEALVALHIVAILFYLVARRTNLIASMLHGRAAAPATTPAVTTPWGRALAIAIAATLVTAFVANGLKF